MKKWMLAVCVAAAGCLGNPASAGVIYHWEQLTSSSTIDSSAGMLEIADSAWLSGHVDVTQRCQATEGGCTPSVSASPVLHFEFGVNGFRPVTVVPDSTSLFTLLDAELDIAADGRLSGYLYGEDLTGYAELGGTPGDWTVLHWVTDEGCWMDRNHPFCDGATGQWVLDRSTLPALSVPGPNPLPLLFLGAATVLWFGRRRAGRR